MPSARNASASRATASTAKQPSTSSSGIVTAENGERHIPASTRADGSVRKEIRVRPGYRPPEDVEVYKNRTAEAWKNRGKGAGIPGAEFVETTSSSKAKNSNNKTKLTPTSTTGTAAKTGEGAAPKRAEEKESRPTATAPKKEPDVKEAEEEDPETVREKEARKLSKKLRQARDLEQKKEKGDSLLPEQFEKIIRINELIRQLDNLGFDTEGQKK